MHAVAGILLACGHEPSGHALRYQEAHAVCLNRTTKTGAGRNGKTVLPPHKNGWQKMTCVECAEPITNPLCPACLQEGILQWLREQGKEELAGAVEERTLQVFSNYGETFCIKCSAQMSLCAYCYTKEIFGIVKGHPELLDQYLVYFNFDLGHLGWEKDAEEVMEENAWKL